MVYEFAIDHLNLLFLPCWLSSPNCYEDIVELCSQPLNKINSLWNEKKSKRQEMIKQYITSFSGGAGKRIAKMIIEKHYL